MTWLYLALMAPLMWSLSNIIDKFAINHIASNWIAFIFLLSVGNIAFTAVIYAAYPLAEVSFSIALLNILSGLAIFMQYFAYSYSLEDMDVSVVIPIHQSEPIFVLVASVLLFHATPTAWQIVGFVLIVLGLLMLCMSRQTLRELRQGKHVVVLLMSALFGAVSTIISDGILRSQSLCFVLIFNFLGYALGGLLLLLVPVWRRMIVSDLKSLSWRQFGVFGLTNTFDVAGYVFFMGALAVGGGAALVSVVVSIHPLFVLLLSYAFAKLFPRLGAESASPSGGLRKLVSIVVIVSGVALISFYDT